MTCTVDADLSLEDQPARVRFAVVVKVDEPAPKYTDPSEPVVALLGAACTGAVERPTPSKTAMMKVAKLERTLLTMTPKLISEKRFLLTLNN